MPYAWTSPHGFTPGESVGLAAWLGQLGTDLWYLRDRVDYPYLNTSGGDLTAGQVLVQDTGDEAALTLPAGTVGEAGPFWVALEPIADGETGYAARTGVVLLHYLSTDPVPGDRLQTGTVAGYCQVGTTNAFATALTTGHSGLVYGLLDGPGAGGGGGGGGSGSNATWDPYGNAVAPVATAFSVHDHWSGSGIITRLDQNADNMVFYNPAAVSIIERGIFVPASVGSPPYAVTACIVPNLIEIDFASVALCLRDSGTDKRIILRVLHDTTLKIGDLYLDDYQTLNGGTGVPSGNLTLTQGGGPIWLRMRDDASNLFYEYSRDGENWVTYQTKTTGLFCTPDQAGFTMDSFTGGSGSAYSMTVLSFEVS